MCLIRMRVMTTTVPMNMLMNEDNDEEPRHRLPQHRRLRSPALLLRFLPVVSEGPGGRHVRAALGAGQRALEPQGGLGVWGFAAFGKGCVGSV